MIVVISCSLNPSSSSRVLAREAERVLKEDGHEVAILDLRDEPLPWCDGTSCYEDTRVHRVNLLLQKADAVLIATPIYNYDTNAASKNLIEVAGSALENKVVGFLCAAGGMSSFMSVMSLANSLMLDFRSIIVPRFVYATDTAFSGETLTDQKIKQRVAELARSAARLGLAVKNA